MPTKTERILSYLPGTFKALPRPTALYSLVDAFGEELLKGENSLAAVMLAHWINHADHNAEWIDDLARIGALYGLAPRSDENVEEFREHLKRYIRTFLEGTVTVQGILRVAAETLALHIAGCNDQLEFWWNRSEQILMTIETRGEDAAQTVLGILEGVALGHDALAAQVVGTVDLSSGTDLQHVPLLHIAVDGRAAVDIDLASGAAESAAVTLDEMVSAINGALGFSIAGHDGRYLLLASLSSGAGSALDILDGPQDAAPVVLGLPSREVFGRDAGAASFTGSVDLSGGVDLTNKCYLRLLVDGVQLFEINCTGVVPASTALDEIRDAINGVFGYSLASHDGQYLTLTSAANGLNSRIEFQLSAAQDATATLFGSVPPLILGQDVAAARIVGTVDLRNGVDLSGGMNLAVRFDDGAAVIVNCTGENPAQTTLAEVVAAINDELGNAIASHNGRMLILTSPSTGAVAQLAVDRAADGDTAELLLGLKQRSFFGVPMAAAALRGRVDLNGGVDLAARYLLRLAVDDGEILTINLRSFAPDQREVTLTELTAAINATVAAPVASHDGQFLILTSPHSGPVSRIAVFRLEKTNRRRFVTRAPIIDEAALPVFGFVSGAARGLPAGQARLSGTVDLSRGVDLRNEGYLRLAIDYLPAVDIDCAGPRPRATTLEQIVVAINTAAGQKVAGHDGQHLVLTSLTAGAGSRLALEPPRIADALPLLFNLEPDVFLGQVASRVSFTGTVDLTAGIDLPVGAAINLAIDGNPAVEIALTTAAEHKNLNQLVVTINLALVGQMASHNGRYLILKSFTFGSASRIEFAAAAGTDVTAELFGITVPRSYQGVDAVAARVVGVSDLSGGVDLQSARFLNLVLDGQLAVEIDCAEAAVASSLVSLDELVFAINTAVGFSIAFHDGSYLELKSPTAGVASRIELLSYTAGNATTTLFGTVVAETRGEQPLPAVLTGDADLLGPVDLSRRRWLRIAVDGGWPVDIAVAGAAPDRTFGDEIVVAINKVFPGMASLTNEDRLQLQSSTVGESSSVALLPLRYLELMEYPPAVRKEQSSLRHGEAVTLSNDGAADVIAAVEFCADQGLVGPALTDLEAGWQVRLLMVLKGSERVRLWRELEDGLRAEILHGEGTIEPVAPDKILLCSLVEGGGDNVLAVPRGRHHWIFHNCFDGRFDNAQFDQNRFAGGLCLDRGIFNVSRFVSAADEPVAAIFAFRDAEPDLTAEVTLRWDEHLPGAFNVQLPADLAPRFGGRFNDARFALPDAGAETYTQVVTEPVGDSDYLPELLNGSSHLVKAEVVPVVPLGWSPVAMPFYKSRFLTLGSETQPARIYLEEEGLPGFLKLEALIPGDAGNKISVAARKSGPALFDVTLTFAGACFENARQVVLGEPLPVLTEKLLQPGPVGILQAKAAGIRAEVTREATND